MKKVYTLIILCLVLSALFFIDIGQEEINANLLNKSTYEDERLVLTIEHFYDKDLLVEYWITTIAPKNEKILGTLINKSFAYSKNGEFDTYAKENPVNHANRVKSIFAINASAWDKTGHSFGVHVKNGVVYQNKSILGDRGYTLGIDKDGIMNVFSGEITGEELVSSYNIKNTFTFSIPIIIDSKEVGKDIYNSYSPGYSKPDPRQIIGQVNETNEIIVLTVDGRTDVSKGMTLPQAAKILLSRDCRVAYNLDGGGSVQTIFHGGILNNPSDGRLRPTSDLLYIQ